MEKRETKPFSVIDYARELDAYLESKIPNVPLHIRLEISQFASFKATIAISDCITQNDRDWRNFIKLNRKHIDAER